MPPETQPRYNGEHGMPRLKRLLSWQAAAAVVAAAGLAAALFTATSLWRPVDSDQGTLRGLQVRVLTISQAAAENRLDGALAALDALEKDLNDAAGQGQISLSRYRGIEAAVESVRTDITNQLAAVSSVVVAPTGSAAETAPATPGPVEAQLAVQTGAQAPAMVPPPVPAPAPAPVPVPAPAPVPVPASAQEEPDLPAPAREAKEKGKGQGKP